MVTCQTPSHSQVKWKKDKLDDQLLTRVPSVIGLPLFFKGRCGSLALMFSRLESFLCSWVHRSAITLNPPA